MGLPTRIITVTAGLLVAGAISGVLSGIVAIEVAVILYLHAFAPVQLAGAAGAIGGLFGAIIAPILAWSVLREVQLGRAIAGIAAAAGVGGAIGIRIGASHFNPFVPFAVNVSPVPEGLMGALLGAILAATYLRVRAGKPAIAQRAA